MNYIFELLAKFKLDVVATYLLVVFGVYFFSSGGVSNYSSMNLIPIIILTFLTAGAYLLNKVCDRNEDSITYGKSHTIKRLPIRNLSFALFLVGLMLTVIFAPFGSIGIPSVLFLILMSFLYSYPFFGWRIKEIFILKNVFAALAWYLSILLVVHQNIRTESLTDFISMFLYLFLIFLAYEITWDIKDVNGDLRAGIKTIPNQWGIPATKKIILTLLIGVVFLSIVDVIYIGILTGIYLMLWLLLLNKDTKLRVYHFILLGQMILMISNILLSVWLG